VVLTGPHANHLHCASDRTTSLNYTGQVLAGYSRAKGRRCCLCRVAGNFVWSEMACIIIIIIIIIKIFNKKVVKRNFTNGKENGVQIIVNNNVYTKLLSRNVVRSDRYFLVWEFCCDFYCIVLQAPALVRVHIAQIATMLCQYLCLPNYLLMPNQPCQTTELIKVGLHHSYLT